MRETVPASTEEEALPADEKTLGNDRWRLKTTRFDGDRIDELKLEIYIKFERTSNRIESKKENRSERIGDQRVQPLARARRERRKKKKGSPVTYSQFSKQWRVRECDYFNAMIFYFIVELFNSEFHLMTDLPLGLSTMSHLSRSLFARIFFAFSFNVFL